MFSDRLRPTLTLAIGTASATFPAGAIRRYEVDARCYGFSAAVEFDVSCDQEDDPIFDAFVGRDLGLATLTLIPCTLDGTGEEPTPLPLTGYVLEKRMRETVSPGVFGVPVVIRRYAIRFADPATVFWRQHRPLELYVDASVKDIIEAHLTQGISLTYDWQTIEDKSPMRCVALPGDGAASFYDWVIAYLDHNAGVFEFDYVNGGYRIGSEKTVASDEAELTPEDVRELEILGPHPYRHGARVLNPFAVAATTTAVTNDDAATGVSHDALLRTPIAADVDTRVRIEGDRLRAPLFGVRAHYGKAPPSILGPGAKVVLSEDWSDKIYGFKKTYRVTELRMTARADEGDGAAEIGDDAGPFTIELVIELEVSTDPTPRLPSFVAPSYPLIVEGKMVSFGGGADDRTWFMVANDDESILQYKVDIPLWNKKVLAPFEPGFLPGHMFFPAYKSERVLVALGFDSAQICGFLDWTADAKVPNDTQGNRIALGYQNTNGTIIDHAYTDAKPVLKIERKAGADHQLIEVLDGTFRITVEELTGAATTTPTYDVTLKVESAKDELAGSTNAAIGGLSGSFGTSFGGAKGSVDSAVDEVVEAVDGAESKLSGAIEHTEAALKALVPSTAALDVVATAIVEAKAGLAQAVDALGIDWLETQLQQVEGILRGAVGAARADVARVEGEARNMGRDATEPLDRLGSAITDVETAIAGRMRLLLTRLSEFEPPSGPRIAPVWKELTAVGAAVKTLRAAATATSTKLVGKVTQASADAKAPFAALIALGAAREKHLEDGAKRLTADIDAALNELDKAAQQALARAPVAKQPALTALRTRLQNAKSTAVGQLTTAVAAVDAPIAQAVASAKTASATVDTNIAALRSTVVTTIDGVSSQARSLLTQYDTAETQARGAIDSAITPIDTSIRSSQTSLAQPLGVLRGSVGTATTTAKTTLQTLQTTINSLLAPLKTALTALEQAVLGPIGEARAKLKSLRSTLDTLVKSVSTAIDSVLTQGIAQVKSLIATVESAIDGAVSGLASIRMLVGALRDQLVPPVEALKDLLAQLQTIFTTAMQLLASIQTAGISTLEAIPATGLMKALVQPAITSIESALSAILPTITSGVEQAGTQLATVASQVQTQASTVTTQMTTQLETLATTITGQIDAVLPPVTAQVEAVEAQLMTIAEGLAAQVKTAEQTALTTISTTSAPIKSAVESTIAQAKTQIDTVIAQTTSAADAAYAQLKTGVDQVRAQVKTAHDGFRAQLETAQKALDSAEATLLASITTAERAVTPQIRAFVTPLQQGLDTAKAALSTLEASVDAGLVSLVSGSVAAAQAANAVIPAAAAIDAQLVTLRASALAPFAAMRAELAAFTR